MDRVMEGRTMFRIGGVSYLNSKPLTLPLRERFEMVSSQLDTYKEDTIYFDAVPSQLAQLLEAGRLDCSLLSSVEVFRLPGAKILSDAAIAAEGPVRSVRLFGRVPFPMIRRVALDAGSRTSVVLTRILLKRKLGRPVEYVPFPLDTPMEALDADACLSIGDRGMRPALPPWNVWTLDLAEEWKCLTGLPFVFAVWIAHPKLARRDRNCESVDLSRLARCLSDARDEGVRRLEEIAATEGPKVGITATDALDYFRHALRFRLGVREIAGLTKFAQLAAEDGLIVPSASMDFVMA